MNPENEPARQHQERPELASSEVAYERLSAYGFARRYTKGKTVADISHQEAGGYGSLLLAQSAESVTALTDLPKLPLPDGRFDVVVAFGVIESLEDAQDLLREARRVLKDEGVLLVSVADKRTDANYRGDIDGQRGMYVPEFRGLLERHFGHVRLYRQGAVAGGFVFPLSEELTGGVPVESVRLSPGGPRLGVEPPMTRSMMAVCSDAAEALGREEERAYLLVDRERGVFAESEEHAEDVELMRDEIRRMQETEVQAFLKAMSAQQIPLGLFLRMIPQILVYYLYSWHVDYQEVSHRGGMVLAQARHRWDTTIAESRHRRDATLAQARHYWEIALAESRHRRDAILEEARHRRNLALEESRRRRDAILEEARHRRNLLLDDTRQRRDLALEDTRRRRDAVIEQARHRRYLALAESRYRRNLALAEARQRRNLAVQKARHRRNLVLEEARQRRKLALEDTRRRRDAVIEQARHRRNLALAEARHRRNLVLEEVRHRRNVTLERIIHRRNIIRGNIHALKQKDARGLARGAFRRLSALNRIEGHKP